MPTRPYVLAHRLEEEEARRKFHPMKGTCDRQPPYWLEQEYGNTKSIFAVFPSEDFQNLTIQQFLTCAGTFFMTSQLATFLI